MDLDPISIAIGEVKRRMALYGGLALILAITGLAAYAMMEHNELKRAGMEIESQRGVIAKLEQKLRDQDANYTKQLADQAYQFTARLAQQNAAVDAMQTDADKRAHQAAAAVAALDKANQSSQAHINQLITMRRPDGVTGCDNADKILNEETSR